MAGTIRVEPLDAVVEEYQAVFSGGWKPKTITKYTAELRDFRAWLRAEKRPVTTASLDFPTLLAYVAYLKAKPPMRGVWRGCATARAASRPDGIRSLNSVNSSMRAIEGFVRWLHEDGRIATNPFARQHRRGAAHPLLPREETPTKGATLDDIAALERGCAGRTPVDFRDQAIVALLKTTAARNSSVRLLKLADVDFERRLITFRRAKGNRTYQVALLPEAHAALVRYLHRGRPRLLPRYPVRGYEQLQPAADPGWLFIARDNGTNGGASPLTANAISQMLTRRYRAGGGRLDSFGSHRIRHGTATLLAANGMPIEELSHQLGHSSTRTTVRYAQPDPSAIGRFTEEALRRSGLTATATRGR